MDIYRLPLQKFAHTVITEAISISELCQTALQQLHILITKVILRTKNAINLQKKYSYGVLKIILLSLRHTYEENTILKQTSFLENLTIIQNSNVILRYLLKFLIRFATQKLIFCYENEYTTSKLCFLIL